MRSSILLFCFFVSHFAFAQLVFEKDINIEPASSDIGISIAEHLGVLYFSANDGDHDIELYRYDTSTGEASLVENMRTQVGGNGMTDVVAYQGKIYFSTSGNGSTKYLHAYDPTIDEVEQVRGIENQRIKSPIYLTVFEDKLFFQTEISNSINKLSYYDANSEQVKIFENAEGVDRSNARYFSSDGDDRMYFAAWSGVEGSSNIYYYHTETDSVYQYQYEDPDGAYALPTQLTYFNGWLFYADSKIVSSGSRTKAINIESGQARTFDPFGGSTIDKPINFYAFDDKLYFSAQVNPPRRSLMVFDPNTEAVSIAFQSLPDGNSSPGRMQDIDGKMYLTSVGNTIDDPKAYLYSYDPISESFSEVATLSSDTNFGELAIIGAFDDKLYCSGFDEQHGKELWTFAPVTGELSLAYDINKNTASATPTSFEEYNERLYFAASEYYLGTNLWEYNPASGSAERTVLVDGGSSPNHLKALGNKLYFSGRTPPNDYGLNKYDAITNQITPTGFRTPSCNGCIFDMVTYRGKLYMSAQADGDDDIKNELYAYNPTTDEGYLVKDVNPDGTSTLRGLVVLGDVLYFEAINDDVSEMYSYNEDTDELRLLTDIDTGEGTSQPSDIIVAGGRLYFSSRGSDNKYELFEYDPQSEKLSQLTFESNGMRPKGMTEFQGKVFFSGQPAGNIGRELHSYNMQTGEVKLELDLIPGNNTSSLQWQSMTLFNDKLYFSHTTDEYGSEMWEYDGATAQIIADIRPGILGSSPDLFTLFNDKLYFRADNGDKGQELWSFASCLNVSVNTISQSSSQLGSMNINVSGGTPPYDYLWDDGSTTENILGVEAGDYTVTITDQSGCISIQDVEVEFATSTDNGERQNISIYPNPTSDIVTVDFPEKTEGTMYVYNNLGKLISATRVEYNAKKVTVDLRNHATGVYTMLIYSTNTILTKQILKQ